LTGAPRRLGSQPGGKPRQIFVLVKYSVLVGWGANQVETLDKYSCWSNILP
jgi:hypothetical protein